MHHNSAPTNCRTDGIILKSHSAAEPEIDDQDGYSPIARLERRYVLGLHDPADAIRRCTSMWGTGSEYHCVEARLGTRYSSTDLARCVQYRHTETDGRPKRNSCSEADTTVFSEVIAESKGSIGDRYRFRYDEYSPESAYSPIAGVKRSRKTSFIPDSHVFSSHVDADGAVCSQPVVGPLALVVRTSDGNDLTVHVKDGMLVRHLKEKLWNMVGIMPSQQHLIMANGGEAVDSMPFAGSGLQPYEVLYLKQA